MTARMDVKIIKNKMCLRGCFFLISKFDFLME